MHVRLAVLMFLQYAMPGTWVPLFSLHLEILHFTPRETAWACSTSALGSLLAPLLWGQIADRWLAAERCIAICAFVGAVILWILADLTRPLPVFVATLAYWFFTVPVLSLGIALTFRHLHNPERDFGKIRLWGTAGWLAAGGLLSFWFYFNDSQDPTDLPAAFRWGSVLGVLLSMFALTLPTTPPTPAESSAQHLGWWQRTFDAPVKACTLFRIRSFAVYCICLIGLYVTIPFSGQMTPLLLAYLGVPRPFLMLTLGLAQLLEILTLGMLPSILLRLSMRGTMMFGIIAWLITLAVLTIGSPLGLVVACLGLQGIFVCCFLITGQVFVNRLAGSDFRGSAQGLIHFFNGAGLLVGHLGVGWMRHLTGNNFAITYGTAATLATCLFAVFFLGFSGTEKATDQ